MRAIQRVIGPSARATGANDGSSSSRTRSGIAADDEQRQQQLADDDEGGDATTTSDGSVVRAVDADRRAPAAPSRRR